MPRSRGWIRSRCVVDRLDEGRDVWYSASIGVAANVYVSCALSNLLSVTHARAILRAECEACACHTSCSEKDAHDDDDDPHAEPDVDPGAGAAGDGMMGMMGPEDGTRAQPGTRHAPAPRIFDFLTCFV